MRKLAFCLTLVSCLFIGASAFAQVYSVNGAVPPVPQENPFDAEQAPPAPQQRRMVPQRPAPRVNNVVPVPQPPVTGAPAYTYGNGYVGPGRRTNVGGGGRGCDGRGCDGGYIGGGCGCDAGGGLISGGCGCDNGACGGGCGHKFMGGVRCGGGGFGELCGLLCGKQHPTYLSLDIGWSVMDAVADNLSNGQIFPPPIPMKDALVGRVGLGKYIGNWRMEGEVGYRRHGVNDIVLYNQNYFHVEGDRRTTSFMTNFFYDVNCRGRFRPYAKCGIGTTYNENEGSRFVNPVGSNAFVGDVFRGDTSWEFAWSVGGGLGIQMTRRLIMDLEYQYIELGSTATGFNAMGSSLGLGKGWAHELTLGFRVNF